MSAPTEAPDELTPASDTTQDCDPVFTCPHCKKKFRNFAQQNKHTRRHDRRHRCSHGGCEKRFRDGTDLQRHLKNVHEVSVQDIPCLITGCTRTFKGRRDNMYKHIRRNHPKHVDLISRDATH
ncbi:unnamed protein product [Periconia digitata]|uniref:C2H2-type domain-containing protein n=1 Tax=Periconia digitata TaxID=1303443 RepID=A0A9W4U716_9PLEO|nr:unnamed protein product [Periconia digitata]